METGFVSVQGYTQAKCASLLPVKTARVGTVPPVFLNPRQMSSASAHMGGLDSSARMVRSCDEKAWCTGRGKEVRSREVTWRKQGQPLTDQIGRILSLVLFKSWEKRPSETDHWAGNSHSQSWNYKGSNEFTLRLDFRKSPYSKNLKVILMLRE